MALAPPLQPTLWRTCRVLANRSRLQIFALLIRQPGQTVSAVADHLKLPLPVASQYLRALEARGLLTVRRAGRRVGYRPCAATAGNPAQGLVTALRQAFQQNPESVETLFKAATAFTHQRRIEIFRVLKHTPQTFEQLQTDTGISARALRRHLKKLEARAFVACQSGWYVAENRPDPLGRELARIAAG